MSGTLRPPPAPRGRIFDFRGTPVRVGHLRAPDPIKIAELWARGAWHELLAHVRPQPKMADTAPTPPAAVDYSTQAQAGLATMLRNDVLGDCGPASDLHLLALRTGVAGDPYVPVDADAVSEYEGEAGYNPSDPSTDTGSDPLAMCQWRQANAYPDGSSLVSYVPVDPTDRQRLCQGIWLAVGVMAWGCLTSSCEGNTTLWDAGDQDPEAGHLFAYVGWTDTGPLVSTWGDIVQATWAFAAQVCTQANGGGCLALVDADCLSRATGLTPAGTDLSGLESYLAGLGGAS